MWCHLWAFLRLLNFDPEPTFGLLFDQILTTHNWSVRAPFGFIQVVLGSIFWALWPSNNLWSIWNTSIFYEKYPPGQSSPLESFWTSESYIYLDIKWGHGLPTCPVSHVHLYTWLITTIRISIILLNICIILSLP